MAGFIPDDGKSAARERYAFNDDRRFGFIPTDATPGAVEPSTALEAARRESPETNPWDLVEDGECPFCEADFRFKSDPLKSLKGHVRMKIRSGDTDHSENPGW